MTFPGECFYTHSCRGCCLFKGVKRNQTLWRVATLVAEAMDCSDILGWMFYGGMFIGILWAVNLGEIVILPPQFAGGTSWTCVHYGCRVRISTKKRLFATFGRSKDFQHQQPCACHRKFIIHKISKQSCKHSNIKTWCFILTLDKSKSPWKGDWIRILGTDPLLVVWSSFVDRRPASGFSITPRWGFQCNRHRSTAYKWLDSSMCIFACATLRLGEAKMEGSKNLTCRNAFPWKHVETNEIFSEVLQETNLARSVFETKISVESSR